MSLRTILAPGIQINEIDKSQYSPAMVGTNCYVMGFTDRGEPYQPMEFTSQAAWQNYYGAPDNEAERYAYAAVNEVLNQGGRLYFARLPYDNPSFEKVAAFKYNLVTGKHLQAGYPFHEIFEADSTVSDATAIEPSQDVALFELSAIDEYRTDEAKVPNNTFLIADIAFNTYDKIPEDTRKNEKREMIGIMPVVTTAANAMYQQNLIAVEKESVVGYETIGTIRTLDAAKQISSEYPALSTLVKNTVLTSDCARLINTKNYYRFIAIQNIRITAEVKLEDGKTDDTSIKNAISAALPVEYYTGSWDGQYQINLSGVGDPDPKTGKYESYLSSAMYSYKHGFDQAGLTSYIAEDSDGRAELVKYIDKFGWHNPDGDDDVPDTVSQEANSYFPTIGFDGEHFDRDNLKKIGVVVYKMYMDPTEGNKISFEPVEAYAGSLCKTDKDPNTGASQFIDTIINTNSKYINFFSNCFNTAKDKKYYHDTLDILVVRPGAAHAKAIDFIIDYVRDFKTAIDKLCEITGIQLGTVSVDNIRENVATLKALIFNNNVDVGEILDGDVTLGKLREELYKMKEQVDIDVIDDTVCPSLGFYADMTKETISISKSLYDGMNKSFTKVEDINQLDIDIVCDAGLANIASYLRALYGDKGEYDLQVTDDVGNSLLGMWKADSNNAAVKTWKTMEQKLDNFCKNIRKDCMFIADGPRPLVLAGQKKVVRPTKPSNTIDANIIPYLKWITGLNTSYGACYVDWFETADDYSGDLFWCPPSIKAMGVYINTDLNFEYWDAPAGLNRGVIAATDVAFSPTIKQAGSFYEKNFNYAINYPNDGIVLEGQKTLQTKPSAFDRVNVRRLFLRLERAAYQVSRYFLYEGNTAYTRQRYVDAIDPYFKAAKIGGGVYDYKIKCDESNNTPETIDRNELHVAIGIKPTKTIEFIMIDFVCLRTGGSWTEAGF